MRYQIRCTEKDVYSVWIVRGWLWWKQYTWLETASSWQGANNVITAEKIDPTHDIGRVWTTCSGGDWE